jgi:hypothetical protein
MFWYALEPIVGSKGGLGIPQLMINYSRLENEVRDLQQSISNLFIVSFLSKNEPVLRASHGGLFSKTKGMRQGLCKRGQRGRAEHLRSQFHGATSMAIPGRLSARLSRPCGASPVALRWSPGSDFSFLKRDPHDSRLGAHGNLNFRHSGASYKYRHLARLEACFRFILDSSAIV